MVGLPVAPHKTATGDAIDQRPVRQPIIYRYTTLEPRGVVFLGVKNSVSGWGPTRRSLKPDGRDGSSVSLITVAAPARAVAAKRARGDR